MKSKKLFAILTLVAFMMTLVPMAAFGAALAYSADKSSVAVTGSTVDGFFTTVTPDENAAKLTITFKDSAGAAIASPNTVSFSLKASKDLAWGLVDYNADDVANWTTDASGKIDNTNAGLLKSSDGLVFTGVTPDAEGKVTVWLGAKVATSYSVSVYLWNTSGSGSLGDQIGSSKTVNVKSTGGDIVLEAFLDDDDTTAQTTGFIAGQGLELRATVPDGAEDVVVTFKQRINGGSWTTIGTDETDDEGVATIYVDTEKKGTYEFKATAGSDDSGDTPLSCTISAGEPNTVELKTAAGKIAVDKSKTVQVYVKDDAGNLVTRTNDISETVVSYEFVSTPADSDFADADEVFLGTDARGIASFAFTPDEVGQYVIKFKLDSDSGYEVGNDSVTLTLDAVELGTVTALSFDMVNADGDAVPAIRYLEDTSDDPASIAQVRAYWLNAAGTKVTAPDADIQWSSSDASLVSVDTNGNLTVEDDAFVGSVTITAVFEDDNVVGTYEVKVAGAPNSFAVTPTVEGKTATVKLQLVDKAGNPTISNNGDFVDKEALKVTGPAGVVVSGKANLDQSGAASFTATAAEYGKYTLTATAVVDASASYNTGSKTLAKSFEINFAQPAAEIPVIGAKNVTMFIGAAGYTQDGVAKVSDVAPFIKDGRTFVAVRPVAEAFGATVGYNEATKTVTLTRSDVTVTIVIGSNAITVVKGGVTSTVTADVAAFIQAGRTVLPFRAVGDAFGAKVNYDAATQAVTYAQ